MRPRLLVIASSAVTLSAVLTVPAGALAAGTIRTAVTASAGQAASPAAVAGYVWNSNSGGTSSLDPYYYYDSASTASTPVTVTWLRTGTYQVDFDGLGSIATSAIVQATAYSTDVNCAVAGWGTDGSKPSALQANVDCYTGGGTLANTDFDLVVTRSAKPPHGVFDYAYVYHGSGKLTAYQYNSSGKGNYVSHLGIGKFRVFFGGPKSSGTHGIVKVTPYGGGPGDCELVGWSGTAAGEDVNVDCWGLHHRAQDRRFMVTYATATSLLGLNGQTVANAFASGKASQVIYQPSVQYSSAPGARITVVRYDTGLYEVLAAGSEGDDTRFGGDVQVNAVGSNGQLCISNGWTEQLTPSLEVACYSRYGNPVNVPFTIEWVVP